MQNKYSQAAVKIILEQELIMGPLAGDLARNTNGIRMLDEGNIDFSGDPKETLKALVMQYYNIFGQTSVEVSKKAIDNMKNMFSLEELPEILK